MDTRRSESREGLTQPALVGLADTKVGARDEPIVG